MVKTHKVKYIHLKRGSKRNILGCIALVYISVDTKLFFLTPKPVPNNPDIRYQNLSLQIPTNFPFLSGVSFGHGWSWWYGHFQKVTLRQSSRRSQRHRHSTVNNISIGTFSMYTLIIFCIKSYFGHQCLNDGEKKSLKKIIFRRKSWLYVNEGKWESFSLTSVSHYVIYR